MYYGYFVCFFSLILSRVVDLKERNILVAQKWAELTDEERKVWSIKAEAMCDSSSYQEPEITIDNTQPTESPEIVNSSIIETTLMKIQEKVCMYVQWYLSQRTTCGSFEGGPSPQVSFLL